LTEYVLFSDRLRVMVWQNLW